MKQNRIMFAALAMTALIMTACNKEPQSFSSFILNTSDLRTPNGTKAHMDASVYWWEEDGSDVVRINGEQHMIYKNGETETWMTQGNRVYKVNDRFYVAYAGDQTGDMDWDDVNYKYGTADNAVSFDGTFVPLAIAGTSNRLTLYPCCAMIKTNRFDTHVEFYKESPQVNENAEAGTTDGNILASGLIVPGDNANTCVLEGEDYATGVDALPGNDGYHYFVIPIKGNTPVKGWLMFDYDNDEDHVSHVEVTIEKGKLYVI